MYIFSEIYEADPPANGTRKAGDYESTSGGFMADLNGSPLQQMEREKQGIMNPP